MLCSSSKHSELLEILPGYSGFGPRVLAQILALSGGTFPWSHVTLRWVSSQVRRGLSLQS